MTALEANLALRSNGASRTLAAEDFFIGTLTTAAESGELLIEVRVPALPRATGWAFDELSRRRGDFALVGAAALVLLNADGRIEWARLAFTGVGERPRRARQTEQALRGQLPNEDVIHAAAELSIADLTPNSDLHASADYRCDVAKVIARRTLIKAIERSRAALQ